MYSAQEEVCVPASSSKHFLVKSGKMLFPGVSEKATLQHKNYTAVYEKFEGRVNVTTTKRNKKL